MTKPGKPKPKARIAIRREKAGRTAKTSRKRGQRGHQAVAGKGSARGGTKTESVLALLSREGGASITDLTTATDWLPHTTRAALTGLRKRGHTIETERNKGSPTIYRLVSSQPRDVNDAV